MDVENLYDIGDQLDVPYVEYLQLTSDSNVY